MVASSNNNQTSEDIAESFDALYKAVSQQVEQLQNLTDLVDSCQKTFEATSKTSNDTLSAKMDSLNLHLDAIRNEMVQNIKPRLDQSRNVDYHQHTLPDDASSDAMTTRTGKRDSDDARVVQQKKASNQTPDTRWYSLVQWVNCKLTNLYIYVNNSRMLQSSRFTSIMIILGRLKSSIQYYVCEILNWFRSKTLVMKVARMFEAMCDGLKDIQKSSSTVFLGNTFHGLKINPDIWKTMAGFHGLKINPIVWKTMAGAACFYVLVWACSTFIGKIESFKNY